MAYCSPKQTDNYKKFKSCFDKPALLRIAESLNQAHGRPITNLKGLKHRELWNAIDERLKPVCGSGEEVCWVDQLNVDKDPVVKNLLRPETPREWVKKPHTWLTNFNIEEAMKQYQSANPSFKFLGVYPVDFQSTEYTGQCLYRETCAVDFKKLNGEGIKYIGMVINLDKQNESGSHWVALFTCIDPTQSCFGTYFYDSYAGMPPKEVQSFMNELEVSGNLYAKSVGRRRKFKNLYNTIRHQYGGSECGMFSMVYLVRWISFLDKRKQVTLHDVVKAKMTDQDVYQLRQLFFRPRYELKKRPIK